MKASRKRDIGYHTKTLFLFTKSDFKTVIFPQTAFAISAALSAAALVEGGPLSLTQVATRLPWMLVWLWTNLLVGNISNQRTEASIIEDAANKPWRPLPAGRLTREEAQSWLMAAIPLAGGSGIVLGAYQPSICLMTLIWMYNDIEGSSSGICMRNLLNAGGLMCISWGGLSVLASDNLGRGFTGDDGP